MELLIGLFMGAQAGLAFTIMLMNLVGIDVIKLVGKKWEKAYVIFGIIGIGVGIGIFLYESIQLYHLMIYQQILNQQMQNDIAQIQLLRGRF